jgi:hypothetical protein
MVQMLHDGNGSKAEVSIATIFVMDWNLLENAVMGPSSPAALSLVMSEGVGDTDVKVLSRPP